MPLGQLVAVEDYLLRRILGRIGLAMGSAVDCVLLTLFGPRVVPPGAVRKGNRDVGLLHVAQHLLVEIFTQFRERGHGGFGVLVFSFEVCGYLGAFFVAQPGVVIGQRDAMKMRLFR